MQPPSMHLNSLPAPPGELLADQVAKKPILSPARTAEPLGERKGRRDRWLIVLVASSVVLGVATPLVWQNTTLFEDYHTSADIANASGHVVGFASSGSTVYLAEVSGDVQMANGWTLELYVSHDRGEDWRLACTVPIVGLPGFFEASVAFAANGSQVAFADVDTPNLSIASSSDGGATWTRSTVRAGTSWGSNVSEVLNPDVAVRGSAEVVTLSYVGPSDGLYHPLALFSADGGAHWTSSELNVTTDWGPYTYEGDDTVQVASSAGGFVFAAYTTARSEPVSVSFANGSAGYAISSPLLYPGPYADVTGGTGDALLVESGFAVDLSRPELPRFSSPLQPIQTQTNGGWGVLPFATTRAANGEVTIDSLSETPTSGTVNCYTWQPGSDAVQGSCSDTLNVGPSPCGGPACTPYLSLLGIAFGPSPGWYVLGSGTPFIEDPQQWVPVEGHPGLFVLTSPWTFSPSAAEAAYLVDAMTTGSIVCAAAAVFVRWRSRHPPPPPRVVEA